MNAENLLSLKKANDLRIMLKHFEEVKRYIYRSRNALLNDSIKTDFDRLEQIDAFIGGLKREITEIKELIKVFDKKAGWNK